MASEKNLHHFCFWHPPLFNFYIAILLPGTKEIFLPDGLNTFLLQFASPLTTTTCYENFKPFKILVAFPRHATSCYELVRLVYDNHRHRVSSLLVATSSPKKWAELNS